MGVTLSQIFSPRASLTEQNLPSQKGKVFIVTGGYSGFDYELVNILFHAGGKIHIAGRSEAKAQQCKEEIKSLVHDTLSAGQLEYLPLELDDLSSIKASAEAFKAKELKLDVFWINAGVSMPPLGNLSKQGHELQIATNCLGPFLFTRLLSHHSKLPLNPRLGALRVSFGLDLRRWSSALPKVHANSRSDVPTSRSNEGLRGLEDGQLVPSQ